MILPVQVIFPVRTRLLAFLALMVAMLAVWAAPASAQNALATVNNVPITNFDVAQRIRIAGLVERRKLGTKAALDELIDDQVKLYEARRVGYRVTEDGVEGEYTKFAKNNRQTNREFGDTLRRAGIEPNALRDKIRADLAWVVLLRDQARKGSNISNDEIEKAMADEQKKAKEIVDYSLQSVIFVVPPGASPGERERTANAARSKFTSCENGLEELRALKDVVIRPPTIRSTEGMNAQLSSLLAKTPVGRMTPAFRSEQGIEMVAVCEKKTRTVNSGTVRADVATNLSEKRMMDNAKTYLASLRKSVDIKYKR